MQQFDTLVVSGAMKSVGRVGRWQLRGKDAA